jgi:hypothetical protein
MMVEAMSCDCCRDLSSCNTHHYLHCYCYHHHWHYYYYSLYHFHHYSWFCFLLFLGIFSVLDPPTMTRSVFHDIIPGISERSSLDIDVPASPLGK